ncbi:MAG: S41 family peptidase [Gammaproteobacteria bacterium]|nr:S41 family peptidase [Gammaproteobacteria bacterium]
MAADEVITEPEPLPLDELRTLAEVYNRIKSTYVEKVDDHDLIKGAIAGMLDSLDPHSTFLDKESYGNLQDSSAGQYSGLGIEVIPENGLIKIITPIDDSPASHAGILPGDLIIRIDNMPLRNIKAVDAMEMMRGEIGENVVLSIRRVGENELLEFNLVREIIRLSSIQSQWLGKGIAYVRITQFQSRTGYDLTDEIELLREQNEGKIEGLVLDLRNNPGGVLMAAKKVSDAFLNEGLIVSTKGRADSTNVELSASKGDVLYGAPLIILINSGSASAAEIVAGALQDHNRAIIMGTRSFGKGSVQTLMPITGEAVLKLTTARYFTPSGRSIQGLGIIPDIEVKQAEIVSAEDEGKDIFEADLKGSLSNENLPKPTSEIDDEKKAQALLNNDFQLSEALNLLRGISILSLKSERKSSLIEEH